SRGSNEGQTLECQDSPAQGRYRGGTICLCSWAIFCCFFVWPHGSLESWSRLQTCSSNCLSARRGSFLLVAYRAQNPASVVNPFRGGVLIFRNRECRYLSIYDSQPSCRSQSAHCRIDGPDRSPARNR